MSIKTKLTSLITTFVLLCSLLTVGVFAVKNTTFNVGGDIVFNVQGIEATITRGATAGFTADKTIGNQAGNILSDITLNNNMSAKDVADAFAPWSGLNLAFSENVATIKLTITNTADEGADNYLDITALASATTKNNARVSVVNDAGGITALLQPQQSASFTITFSVIDDEYSASLNGFSVNFDMQKKALADFQTAESLSEAMSFEYNETAMTVVVADNDSTNIETLEIPGYVNNGGKIYKVVGFGRKGPASGFYSTEIKNISFPNTITVIDEELCANSEKLESIVIPASITSIGNAAFPGCLKKISISKYNAFYEDRDMNVIVKKGTKELIYGSNDAIIPNDIEIIGNYAFYNHSFTNFEIPDSVISIGEAAFSGCQNLKNVTIPSSVTTIGKSAFEFTGLTSVSIPNSITSIEQSTFAYCQSLSSVTIPDSVTIIEDSAFMNCSSLTNINIPNSVTSIEGRAFYGCGLTSITIPSSVTIIEDSAFKGCKAITSIEAHSVVENIQDIFSDTDVLEYFIIADGVTSIAKNAFDSSSCAWKYIKIIIPTSVTSFGEGSFSTGGLYEIMYKGTEEQWNAISGLNESGVYDNRLEINFNYTGE